MRHSDPVAIERRDYRPSPWRIPHTRLRFELRPDETLVHSELDLLLDPAHVSADEHRRSGDASDETDGDASTMTPPLSLDGVELDTLSITLDGEPLSASRYTETEQQLVVRDLPPRCRLAITTRIDPDGNTALEGLYRSSGNYCTQCEAEGFRKITWYLDRPDILSLFDVTIEADPVTCPVLLSNGNLLGQERLSGGRVAVHWQDPFPKPSYLFALVAGDLAVVEDTFRTRSGREVLLQIYVQAHNLSRCDFAMKSLKAAMRWDEEVYGFEYDLDRFMIVAVDDFNMGAMENKGLNIFNSRYVLADAESATDSDFLGIESVVAHEYFHNWTGNRITCRDWFQLSLKEGLTVFRDQCFSADRHSATLKRIQDVRLLRNRQFPEDAGPMAHPIRPESYIEINNFYTVTVYEKGAEVVRMLHTLIGPHAWREGMDLYVARHDGEATTCNAFVDCMQAVTGIDLQQFRLWYSTAGTPTVSVEEHYDVNAKRLRLTLRQSIAATPGQADKPALHIPLVLALLDDDGRPMPIHAGRESEHGALIDLREAEEVLVFEDLPKKPLVSLFRNFSAPIRLQHDVDSEMLARQLATDDDGFNRWDAGTRLATRVILELLSEAPSADAQLESLLEAFAVVIRDAERDPAFSAELLTLPAFDALCDAVAVVDVHALLGARRKLATAIARRFRDRLLAFALVEAGPDAEADDANSRSHPATAHKAEVAHSAEGTLDSQAVARRRLSGAAMKLLGVLPEGEWRSLALEAFRQASNMTDSIQALTLLCQGGPTLREEPLADFYRRWRGNRLVVDKWFAVQASSEHGDVVERVEALREHADFDAGNPNRVRSLLGMFAAGNPAGFHDGSGRGYELLAEQVMTLDGSNPQTAASLLGPLCRWRRFAEPAASRMRRQLERIAAMPELSPDVFELVEKSLR